MTASPWRSPSNRVAVCFFVAIGLAATSRAWKPGFVVGAGVDLYGTLWFYWWQLQCLMEMEDPGFTDLFFYPLGKNIFAHTGNNLLDATVSIPFQFLFGALSYQKWFVVAVLVANGLTFLPLSREVLGRSWGALFASVAWVLNPYSLFEIHCGRLTQAFLVFVPLAFLAMLRIEKEGGWRWALLLGLSVALQAWTYWFMGWFLVLGLLPLAFRSWRRVSERRLLLKQWAAAVFVCSVVVGPAMFAMVNAAGAGEVPGLAQEAVGLFGTPGQLPNNVAASLHGYDQLEQDDVSMLFTLTWGLPLLLWMFKGPNRQPWLAVLVLAVMFSVGPQLKIGEFELVMPHYMLLYDHLPFFDRLWFPYRLLSIAMVPACLCIGSLIQWSRAQRAPVYGMLFVLGSLGEQGLNGHFPLGTTQVAPPKTVEWIGEHQGAIIHLPFGIYGVSVVWQTIHGQPMFGGMGENAGLLWPDGFSRRLKNRLIHQLLVACRAPAFEQGLAHEVKGSTAAHRQALYGEGYRWVVLDRGLAVSEVGRMRSRLGFPDAPVIEVAEAIVGRLVEILGEPVAVDGALVTWHLDQTSCDTGSESGMDCPPPEVLAPESLRFSEARLIDVSWMEDALLPEIKLSETSTRGRTPIPSTVGSESQP